MSYNEDEILVLHCKYCDEDIEPVYKEVIFKNATKHVEASCPECGRYIQYISQGAEDILHFGKYKGKTIGDISLEDKPYLEWLLKQPNLKNNLMNKIKKYI